MKLNVTVCELPDDRESFDGCWTDLQRYIETESSDIVVLNEAPFDKWFAQSSEYVESVWNTAVDRHTTAIADLEFGCSVIATAPINQNGRRHNQAFSWDATTGYAPWRRKAFLPDEESVYEATWYQAAPDQPDVRTIAEVSVGVLTCTEIWQLEWASRMGQLGAQMIATPRATGSSSLDKWFAAGRVAAICSGAYSVSSNRVSSVFGGGGWIFSPDGDLLARTDRENPFATATINLEVADEAKSTYPRYALWART